MTQAEQVVGAERQKLHNFAHDGTALMRQQGSNALPAQVAVIVFLWALTEGCIAHHWWDLPDFSTHFASVGIPVSVSAIVMIAWVTLRACAIRFATRSIQGKIFGIASILAGSVLGGFMPYWIGRISLKSEFLNASFNGDAGWPAAICSVYLWMLGAIFFLACMVEILIKKIQTP